MTAMPDLEQLRYPVGRFERLRAPLDADRRRACIDTIEQAPARLRALVAGRSERELDTPYRPGGWTVRQVVHHVPDSHMNAYIRMKFAVTEEAPAIRAYNEADWAELPEAKSGPAEISLALLEALHRRWVAFLRALPPDRFARAYVHPELGRVTLDEAVALYAWHCQHHTAHVELGLGAVV
jgi:DinB family protein